MILVLSILAFLLLLSVLILIHECGHFLAARKFGVEVEEFGFGLPPRAMTLFRQRGTKFSLNWIPFGGFVRLKGENALDAGYHRAPGSFGAASIPARIIILCGGVFMNFLLAIIILTFGFSAGRWVPLSAYMSVERMEAMAEAGLIELELGVRIGEVFPESGAAKAGVPSNSILVAIDGEPVEHVADVPTKQEGKWRVVYTVRTAAETETRDYTVVLDAEKKAGVALLPVPLMIRGVSHSFLESLGLALSESWAMMVQTTTGIGQLFLSLAQSGTVPEGITGIVGIAQYTHTSVQEGIGSYLRLVALLNLSLAALNILPFPALDGGRLLFVLAEGIRRRPVNRRFELATNGVGFVVLILLIILITYHDILRLF